MNRIRGKRATVAVLGAAAALLLLAPAVPAATITVDTTSQDDAVDNACSIREAFFNARFGGQVHTEAGECTAGVQADAVQPDADTIEFAPSFNGELADTISLNNGVTEVFDDLTLDGGDCDPGPAPKPCVGLHVPSNQQAMNTNGFDNPQLSIRGVSIAGGFRALLQATNNGGITLKGSWIGLRLDGTPAGNGTGMLLYGDNTIGGTTAQDRNVFAANGNAIEIQGGSDNVIQGNYFGTEPDGDQGTGMGNSNSNIVIGASGAGVGNIQIGGPDTGTPTVCDGACNVLAGTDWGAIDMSGPFPSSGPTSIEGNFIGLGPDGTQAYSDSGDGIITGNADQTSIGDGTAAGRNYIAGAGGDDIEVSSGAADLEISNNFIGLNSAGTAKIPAGVNAVGGSAVALSFTDNRVGGRKVSLNANNSTFTGSVFGVGVGGEDVGYASDGPLALFGNDNTIGGDGAGEGNVFGNMDLAGESAAAVRISGSSNDVFGNRIGVDPDGDPVPNASNGIALVQNFFNEDSNRIGGTGAGEANVISSSGGDAIHVPDGLMTSDNETFLANTGHANGTNGTDLFIDLGTDGPGNGDGGNPPAPNQGILAPIVADADTTHIEGTSAEADGTTVQVYRVKFLQGDVRSYLGQATVSSGDWSFDYPAALGAGICVAAAQTAAGKGTSEMTTSVIGGGADCDNTAPVAKFTSGPTGPTNQKTATFAFGSDEPGSTFECSLDGAAPLACGGSATTGQLAEGAHTFQVTPTDTAGNAGAPVTRSWSVDSVAPNAAISRAQVIARKRRVKVFFTADDPGVSFQCKLDARAFAPCGSPVTFGKLRPGRHTIQVLATDAVGNADATPAVRKVRIRRR